jgi:hypothetical protein
MKEEQAGGSIHTGSTIQILLFILSLQTPYSNSQFSFHAFIFQKLIHCGSQSTGGQLIDDVF